VNIYVSNIAFNATTQDLRQLFESYGVVDKIDIITDRYTGQSRGFGFVEMPDSAAAKAAIQGVQGKELAGRTLTVNEAKPREPRREPRQDRWSLQSKARTCGHPWMPTGLPLPGRRMLQPFSKYGTASGDRKLAGRGPWSHLRPNTASDRAVLCFRRDESYASNSANCFNRSITNGKTNGTVHKDHDITSISMASYSTT